MGNRRLRVKVAMVKNASPLRHPKRIRSKIVRCFEKRQLQRYPGIVKIIRPMRSLSSSSGSTGIGVFSVFELDKLS